MTPLSDWEKFLKRRSDNIGFISRLGAFKDPTPAEIARAIMIETKSWQKSIGKKPYTTSQEYKTPIKINTIRVTHRKEAIAAYLETPINIGKETWLVMDWWTAIRHWFKGNKIKLEEKK